MEKLREMVMKMATADQKKTLSPSQISQIEEQLQIAFPSGLQTPNHPPYAAMIYKAITKLNEQGGSSEESISECIKAEYMDLPFAHKSFLSQHLRKLCVKGFVVFSTGPAGKRYMIRNLNAIKRTSALICVTPSPEEYKVSEDNCCENQESEENNARKRIKPKRQLVFNEEDEHDDELCKSVKTMLNLTRGVKSLDSIGKGRTKSTRLTTEFSEGESSKGLVKRKNKGMKKWMITALSNLPDEETPKELHMGNQIIEYNERKDPSCLLESLVQTRFFEECKIHSDGDSTNKCNLYCVDCMNGALCNSCRSSHKDHNLIRISQSVWENAVAASHIQKYIDISEIQAHLMNTRTYISMKRTVGSRRRKYFTGACVICKRHLPQSFKFCSLYCKFVHDLASNAPSATN